MPDFARILIKLDRQITASRLNALAIVAGMGRAERIERIASSTKHLPDGAYLLGTGPSTVGIIPLTLDEVVLGRMATPAEEPSDTVVDYVVSDTLFFVPHEVSRVHAKIVRDRSPAGLGFRLIDLGSTCGTFVNDQRVQPEGNGCRLTHGDVLSLGSSRVSTYLFYVVGEE